VTGERREAERLFNSAIFVQIASIDPDPQAS
jgi:hypothetical protein